MDKLGIYVLGFALITVHQNFTSYSSNCFVWKRWYWYDFDGQ